MKHKLISFVLSLAVVLAFAELPISARAAGSPASLTNNEIETPDIAFNTVLDSTEFEENLFRNNLKEVVSEPVTPIANNPASLVKPFSDASPRANSQYDLGTEPAGNLTATIGQDQTHLFLFKITASKYLFSKMISTNNEYAYQIYRINDTGDLEIFCDYALAGGEINGMIPAGQYLFVVTSLGDSYGDSYTLFMNAATPCPSNAVSLGVLTMSDSYRHVTVQIGTSDGNMVLYCDGVRAFDQSEPSLLDWERVLDLSWSTGYNYNKHEIYDAVVSGISGVGTYTSDYVTSDNAVILYLDIGTGYMYNESKRNWNTGEHIFHFNDPAGNTTPRKLNADDIANYHCRLIFDLNTGRSIDFWSELNWYYAMKTETANFVAKGD